jgi:hypothetical protein
VALDGVYTEGAGQLPQLNCLISGTGDDEITAGEKLKGGNLVVVALQGFIIRVSLKVPEFYRHVSRARGQDGGVGRKHYVVHNSSVALKGLLVISAFKVPEPN